MDILKITFITLMMCAPLRAEFPSEVKGQILFHMHRGDAHAALTIYLEAIGRGEAHDFELLQQAAIRLLEEGSRSGDPAIQLMCQFGAGVAANSALIPILERGIKSKDLKIQMTALNFLAKLQDDRADALLWEALSSSFILTRLEASLQLAGRYHHNILEQLQSLYFKVPVPIRPLFPQIVVLLDSGDAEIFLRHLLTENDLDVRIEAILQTAQEGWDELLPQIRILATQTHFAQQESCAAALGALKDESSIPLLLKLLDVKRSNIRLAAAAALYQLGQKDKVQLIESEAKNGNLFAISALGKCDCASSKNLLASLLSASPDLHVRLNAVFSLLLLHDERASQGLKEILITESRDIGFMPQSTPGKVFKAWKVLHSASSQQKTHPGIVQQTLKLREQALRQALELPEPVFLEVARMIFDCRQTDLIPALVELLRNHSSPGAVSLLKEKQQTAGAPLIRNYCNLALYRMEGKEPYESNLIAWVSSAQQEELIRFRESEPASLLLESRFELTPEETSALLISAFEALAQAQNEKGIEALVRAIAYGNVKNRYALAGLLIKTTE